MPKFEVYFHLIASTSCSEDPQTMSSENLFLHFVFLQEGGVNLLAQLGDCAADDLSHYDVTSELVREISMAAKR